MRRPQDEKTQDGKTQDEKVDTKDASHANEKDDKEKTPEADQLALVVAQTQEQSNQNGALVRNSSPKFD